MNKLYCLDFTGSNICDIFNMTMIDDNATAKGANGNASQFFLTY